MTRTEALQILMKYWNLPVFCVQIGICSPQVEHVDLESALAEMDRCSKFTTEFLEYVYIYPSEFVTDHDKLHDALLLFNLGRGRSSLNSKRFT